MPRTFPVIPPPSHAAWLLAVALAIPAVAVVMGIASPTAHSDALPSLTFGLGLILAVAAFTFWGLARRAVRLDGNVLAVKAAMFQRRVDVAELDLARARIVDLDERIQLKPGLKAFGMSLPGFQAGWFLLRDRSRAFCLLTARRRVLWLPLRSGTSLLLSLERPETLLEALRTAAAPAARST